MADGDADDLVVHTCTEPSAAAFWRDHVEASVPLVLRAGVRGWGGLNWSDEYLRRWADEARARAWSQRRHPRAACAPARTLFTRRMPFSARQGRAA